MLRLGILALALMWWQPALATPEVSQLERSVVRILALDSSGGGATGSGVVVTPDGHVVTNSHVIEGAEEIHVLPTGFEDVFEGRVIFDDPDLDIAILDVPGLSRPMITLLDGIPNKGGDVFALGFPGAADFDSIILDPTLTTGVVSRIFMGQWHSTELGILQHSAPVNPGNSGGPLFDDCGRVIGINTVSLEQDSITGIFFSSQSIETIRVLDDLGLPHRTADEECLSGGILGAPGSAPQQSASAPNSGALILEGSGGGGPGDSGTIIPATIYLVLGLLFIAVAGFFFWVATKSLSSGVSGTQSPNVQFNANHGQAEPPTRVDRQGGAYSDPQGVVLSGIGVDGRPVRIDLRPHALESAAGGVVIGRHPSIVDHVVSGDDLSRRHARIETGAKGLTVEDLNSTNGTYLNGHKLSPYTPTSLSPGDRVRFGQTELMLSRA